MILTQVVEILVAQKLLLLFSLDSDSLEHHLELSCCCNELDLLCQLQRFYDHLDARHEHKLSPLILDCNICREHVLLLCIEEVPDDIAVLGIAVDIHADRLLSRLLYTDLWVDPLGHDFQK